MRTSTIKSNSLLRRVGRGIAVAVFWLLLWQLISMVVGKEVLVPAPLIVLRRLGELICVAAFWQAAFTSLLRVVLGFFLGLIAGVLLAAATVWLPFVGLVFAPLLTIIKATPVASFIILALVWLETPAVPVFAAFLMVLPILWGNVSEGIRSIDPKLAEMTRAFSFSRPKRFFRLTVPSVLPYFLAGCRSALGLAWKAGIAAEVLCTPVGSIGKNLYEAKIYLETPDVFAWTAVVILLSLMIEKLFLRGVHAVTARRYGGNTSHGNQT